MLSPEKPPVCKRSINECLQFNSRNNNRLKRLIHNTGFDRPEANITDINYTPGRKLNKELINRLAACEYIAERRNLFITGATDCGKTYMACAFGMEACKQYYNTSYVRLPDLLVDLEIEQSEGSYKKIMAKYASPLVLIQAEWPLLKPTESEQRDIFELLHRICHRLIRRHCLSFFRLKLQFHKCTAVQCLNSSFQRRI